MFIVAALSSPVIAQDDCWIPDHVKAALVKDCRMLLAADKAAQLNDIDFKACMALINEDNCKIRCTAAYALGESGDKEAVKPLIGLLDDENAHVRRIAAAALGKIGDGKSVESLINLVSCETEPRHVKSSAARALGMIGGERAVDILNDLAESENGWLKNDVVKALNRLASKS